ncbi:TPA: hypothetical protein DEP21_05205 [Patescibacteria group bacterium]|nr:hypothetical protein [Candidatus Gracilibacteria bacterium]
MIGDESCIGNCSLSIDLLKQNFSYCSVHAPEYAYHKDDPKSHTILKYLDELCQRYPIQNVVVHPRKVKDRDIFLQYPNLPISIENMDDKKPSHKTPEDIGKILEKYPF